MVDSEQARGEQHPALGAMPKRAGMMAAIRTFPHAQGILEATGYDRAPRVAHGPPRSGTVQGIAWDKKWDRELGQAP